MEITPDHSALIYAGNKLLEPNVPFRSYQDHRMVMSAAMLSCVLGQVEVEDPEVVDKSYPGFWEDMRSAGFVIKAIG